MKLHKKLILSAVCVLSTVVYATAIDYSTATTKLSTGLNDFTTQLTTAIPQVATQQDIWADAYIGKLFPSIILHCGGGVNAGLTHIDTTGLSTAAKALDIDSVPSSFYMPTLDADLRIGGVFLPFDIGINVMKLNTLDLSALGTDLSFDFFTIGIDARYAVLQENLVLPTVSVGAGYVYSQGGFAVSNDYANLGVNYKTQTAYLSAQVSKKLLIFTPFAGLRALVSTSNNDWNWSTSGTIAAGLTYAGYKTKDSADVTTSFDLANVQPQIFAGCGFNFLIMQATLSVTADLRNIYNQGLWSGALSLRAKL